MNSVSSIIANAQITNGGPVILLQPENEYSEGQDGVVFPNYDYFSYVEQQYRSNSIVVPSIDNDNAPHGYFAPGQPASVDIYGHDSYPQGFDCAEPYTWNDGALPTNFHDLHEEQSPTTPYSIVEFQGGSFDPWGGYGFNNCAILLNNEFERVFYKNDFSFGVTILNLYMTYGGTNWGNIGHPGGYSSYDYGAAIAEDRTITREKYSEAKLLANFVQASPAYLTATPGNVTNGSYTNSPALAVTPLFGNGSNTAFYVVRHATYNSLDVTNYTFNVNNLSLPQLGGQLTLSGRDSKIHVTDYNVGTHDLAYSTADVFTWKNTSAQSVLVVYGGPDEQHELAVAGSPVLEQLEGPPIANATQGDATIVNWETNSARRVLQFGGDLTVYLLDRNTAYNFFVFGNTIVQAGYLIRNITFTDPNTLALVGDLNATSPLEIISADASNITSLNFNGAPIPYTANAQSGAITANLTYAAPTFTIPDLGSIDWKFLDSLPEINSTYDDSLWPDANLTQSPNIEFSNLTTPVSLYGGDYGFHYGSLIYRGHFVSGGNETSFSVLTQGGLAYGASVWLNDSFLGSWPGVSTAANHTSEFNLQNLPAGASYVFTVVIDVMGLDENYAAGDSGLKNPRGILDYELGGRDKSAVTWKLTGNLGGENYRDLTRGPLNEGGMYAERQGYHLPGAPTSGFPNSKPTDGITAAGIGFFSTTFDLSFPKGYDIPLSFMFTNSSDPSPNYRVQLFVNGYQFGKYVNQIGPQTLYPVPEGILNHQGSNYVAVTLWAQNAQGAKLADFALVNTAAVQSGYGDVVASPQTGYAPREGVY